MVLCLLFFGGCVCYCQLSFFFLVHIFYMYCRIGLLRFELCQAFFQFEIGALGKVFLDISVSPFFPSFWCVSIVFELH